MTRILMTRPREQSYASAEKLSALGHACVIAPMAEAIPLTFEVPDEEDALVLTSCNAVRFGLIHIKDFGRPVFTVGAATAGQARDMGFYNVTEGPGTARGLLNSLTEFHAETGRRIIHLRGQELAFRLASALTKKGIPTGEKVAYKMSLAEKLPEDARQALKEARVSTVLFYSARAAQHFENLVLKEKLASCFSGLCALTLSDRISASLIQNWRAIRHACLPQEQVLFKLLEQSE